MQIFDYICLGLCAFHCICFIYELIHGLILGKRIDKLCDKCGMPVYTDEEHACLDIFNAMSADELKLVLSFIDYLRKEDIK